MSSTADQYPACGQTALAPAPEVKRPSRGFWPSILRIAVFEIVLLLALAGVFVAYLEWSSEASFAEFLAATKTQAAPNAPLSEVHLPCKKGV